MITPIHDDVHPPFGLLFTGNILVIVDERADISGIIEQYTARGTIAGDTITRGCAPGAVLRGNRGLGVAAPYGEPL